MSKKLGRLGVRPKKKKKKKVLPYFGLKIRKVEQNSESSSGKLGKIRKVEQNSESSSGKFGKLSQIRKVRGGET